MGALLIAFVRWSDRLSEGLGHSLSVLMPVMVLVITCEVVSRYFLAAPTIWAYDTALLCFAWVGMLGGAYALRRNAHIRVDILSARLSPRGQAVLELITLPLILFFLVLIIWQVGGAAIESWQSGARRPTEFAPPLILFWVTAPIGAALLIVQVLANSVRAVLVITTGREITQ